MLFSCKHRQSFPQARPSRQKGAVLLVGLIILLVITLIGTSGITTVTLDERMTSNMQNANKAFQGAEAVLAECEATLRDNPFYRLETGAAGINILDISVLDDTVQWWNDETVWQANGNASANNTLTAGVDGLAALPTCIVEYIGGGGGALDFTESSKTDQIADLYRVTAFSVGADNTVNSIVQSIFIK